MSYVKNVAAFEKLIGVCTGYGGTYNPGQQNLRLEGLSDLLMRAHSALQYVSKAKTNYENATNDREVEFNELNKLTSRIFAELKSFGVLPQTVDNARTMVRKIKGRSASKDRAPASLSPENQQAEQTQKRTRIRGTDFGSIAYHFEKLMQTIAAEPMYQSSIPDLQLQNLQERLSLLRSKNDAVTASASELGKARRERNFLLDDGIGNLHSTAMAVKQHARAAYGYNSEAAKAATHIRFYKSKKE